MLILYQLTNYDTALMIPSDIHSATKGKIIKRQTTYVEIVLPGGNKYKIRYLDKEEYLLNEDEFKGISISTDQLSSLKDGGNQKNI